MTLLAFLLGLSLGIGFWLWQKRRLQKQLKQMLGTLQTDSSSTALPIVSRLRREIVLANENRKELEEELQITVLSMVLRLVYLPWESSNKN